MNAEFLQVAKVVELAATGDPDGNDVKTIDLESGTPYRHVCMYLHGSAANVSAQPMFGGQADGAPTVVAGAIAAKIFQIALEEVRPVSRGLPGDLPPLKTQLELTNGDAAPAKLGIFIVASAATGGA